MEEAGWLRPVMPRTGQPYSVMMGNLGELGWISDRAGYRYAPVHPATGQPWPAMPPALLEIWRDLANCAAPPECCLVNLYRGNARMGLHQDRDEREMRAPVLSLSLGDRALFRVGGLERRDPTRSFTLSSGDVVRMGGGARLMFHGIDRIIPASSTLIPGGGRLNLTLRRVTPYPG
ncbi:alkylated DNA repair protein (DNA oxidative demethylase) [Arboricoccus pini]|uniref:Alkylated DNA repair protein (DNA oxidative demethylase) n=1 Tax=Arboricoccus pini TaxID=1963835 RepID=A0A212PZP8_9PROT|nr:alkylated DNA repair protein (DNA oxidative demethylase) [Arboricoccus pini]